MHGDVAAGASAVRCFSAHFMCAPTFVFEVDGNFFWWISIKQLWGDCSGLLNYTSTCSIKSLQLFYMSLQGTFAGRNVRSKLTMREFISSFDRLRCGNALQNCFFFNARGARASKWTSPNNSWVNRLPNVEELKLIWFPCAEYGLRTDFSSIVREMLGAMTSTRMQPWEEFGF